MNKFNTVLFFLLGLCGVQKGNAQVKFFVGGHAMPAAFISTERRYSEYFGDDKVQPILQTGGRVGLEINDHWLIFTGFTYHKRKVSTDCMYVITPGGPYPVQAYNTAFFSKTTCTHTAKRDYSIIEVPLLLGYKFKTGKKVVPYFLAGFSPCKKVNYTETRKRIDTGEVSTFRRSYSSEFGYLFYSYLSVGVFYSIAPNFNILSELVYRVDDKTFKDNTIGISLGVGYKVNLKK